MTQINVDEIIDILFNEKEAVNNISILLDDRIIKCIKKIKDDVEDLDNIIKTISNEKKDIIKRLKESEKKLSDKALEIIEDNIENVEKLIIDNLPNGIKGSMVELDKNSIAKIELTMETKVGNKSEEKYVGNIKIIKGDMTIIEVSLDKDKISSESKEFELNNIHRIYKVISYINDNLSYNE